MSMTPHTTPGDVSADRVSEVAARLFDREGLPDRVQLLEGVERQRLRKGDVFTWCQAERAYRHEGGRDLCVSAWYVRQQFMRLFTYAAPKAEQMDLVTR